MPRYKKPVPPKPDELVQAEQAAVEALAAYFNRDRGLQAQMSRDTGMTPTTLSKMGKGENPISLEQAFLIEAASGGELRAEMLCPSRKELICSWVQARVADQKPAA